MHIRKGHKKKELLSPAPPEKKRKSVHADIGEKKLKTPKVRIIFEFAVKLHILRSMIKSPFRSS